MLAGTGDGNPLGALGAASGTGSGNSASSAAGSQSGSTSSAMSLAAHDPSLTRLSSLGRDQALSYMDLILREGDLTPCEQCALVNGNLLDLAIARENGTVDRSQTSGKVFVCTVHKELKPPARLKAIRSLDPAILSQVAPAIVPSRRPRPLVALPQVSCERIRHDGRL